jgi:hypothetical protein
MKKQIANLAGCRHELLEKIAAQRAELVEISQQWQAPLALVDTGLNAARFIRSHPMLLAGAVAGILVLRRTGAAGLVLKGWRLLYLYSPILSFGLKFLPLLTRARSIERNTNEHL